MNELEFRISTGLKNIIGKDLITDDFIAIFELVKNAYDAYANKVILTFENDKIIIADNGKGMSNDDIQKKWLFVAYSAKKDGTEDSELIKQESYRDKIKRNYAGAKGIGRFSCDRLAKHLKLTTRTIKSIKLEQIEVDWTKFEGNQEKEFVSIKVGHSTPELSSANYPDNASNGTILEMTGLNGEWNRENLKLLKHSLEKLINPFSEKKNFVIEIICEKEKAEDNVLNKDKSPKYIERDKINGDVKNSILDILSLKTTQVEVTLDEKEIYTTISDRGTIIYKIKENNSKYKCLKDVTVNLYYLNQAAKTNFTKKMGGIQPVNYGSIFLFKNGFRVQPFGNKGDDSWGLDYRAQQGHSRFLGTRDLFGRVDIKTEDPEELKEVSSRDGGLIKNDTSEQLLKVFEDAHRRLERYVSGVLWGEAFLRKEYFKNEVVALSQRKILLDNDKEYDNPNYILQSSIGSKIDFVQLVKTLSKDKEVEVIYYNKDLANLVSDPLLSKELKPQFIADLEKIAADTNDNELLFSIDEAKRQIADLIKAKDVAEQKAKIAERKRIEAEEKSRLAEIEKKIAEEERKAEEEAKKIAQIQAKEAELKRREEEIKRKEAEQKQKEEAAKRIVAEAEKTAAILELDVEKDKNKYLVATHNTSQESKDLMHTIQISSNELLAASKSINSKISELPNANIIIKELDFIYFHIERINKLSSLLTKADISMLKEYSKVDIPTYIKEYLPNYNFSIKEIKFNETFAEKVIRKTQLLDLSVILDNLVSNSKKANAKKIFVDFKIVDSLFCVDFSDNGDGVDLNSFNKDSIFELGITNRRGGSGIGLSTIKEAMKKELNGDIEFIGNGLHFSRGATFRLKFR